MSTVDWLSRSCKLLTIVTLLTSQTRMNTPLFDVGYKINRNVAGKTSFVFHPILESNK